MGNLPEWIRIRIGNRENIVCPLTHESVQKEMVKSLLALHSFSGFGSVVRHKAKDLILYNILPNTRKADLSPFVPIKSNTKKGVAVT